MSNLDVWAIQYYPEELLTALTQIKEGMNIIYSNLTCAFRIGSKEIKTRQFDTILYNEESDILIMLMRGGQAKKEDMIKYLEDNNKQYTEVSFAPTIEYYRDSDSIPELWFAREEYVIKDALNDSKIKGINYLEYYPNVIGNINLGYITNSNNSNISIDGRSIKGLIKLEDKIVLIINQENNKDKNLDFRSIISIIRENNMEFDIVLDKEVDIIKDNCSKHIYNKK